MITNYSPPRLTIEQVLDILPQAALDRLNALIAGPQYFLQRYQIEESNGVVFTGTGTTLAYEGAEDNYVLDTDYTRVFGENLEARLAEYALGDFVVYSASERNVLRWDDPNDTIAGPNLDPAFFGRAVKVGDIFRVTDGDGNTKKRRVTALRGVTTASSVEVNNGNDFTASDEVIDGNRDNSEEFAVVNPGDYTGAQDTTYIVEVIGLPEDFGTNPVNDMTVRIRDTQNLDVVVEQTLTDDTAEDLGELGLTFKITSTVDTNEWQIGDIYFTKINAASESTTDFDKAVLNGVAAEGAATDDTVIVDHRIPVSQEINKNDVESAAIGGPGAWEDNDIETGLTVTADLRYFVSDRTTEQWIEFTDASVETDNYGRLFITFRALVPPESDETYIQLNNLSRASEELGNINAIDNPLGFGARQALRGSEGKPIYVLRVSSDDEDGYSAALEKVKDLDIFYIFAPMNNTDAVHRLFGDHVSSASTRDNMNWRRAYLGTDSPGEWGLATRQADGTNLEGKILEQNGQNILFTTEDVDLLSLELGSGDKLRINYTTNQFDAVEFDEYVVDEVVSETELLLTSGPASPSVDDSKFELWKADTIGSQALYLNQRAASLGNRRAVQVWVEDPRTRSEGETRTVSAIFAAAELAGTRSAILPQQGLTRMRLTHIDSAPAMFTRYDDATLNDIAANGTFIIHQDMAGGPVYVRHQLTTDVSRGSLYYEDSVGVNVDMIAYEIRDILAPYIGRRNANSKTLTDIRNAVHGVMQEKTEVSTDHFEIGPPIIDYTIERLEIDSQLPDRIKVVVRIIVPLPLNRIEVVLGVGALTEDELEDFDVAIAAT